MIGYTLKICHCNKTSLVLSYYLAKSIQIAIIPNRKVCTACIDEINLSSARTEPLPPLVPETMSTRDPPLGSVRPSTSQSLMEDRLPSKRYSLTRREARPGVEERMELGPFRGRGRGKQDKSTSVCASSSSPVIGLSGPRPTSGSPVIGSHSCITPMVAYENYSVNTPPASNKLEQFANSASPEKREEMVHTLQKVSVCLNTIYV